MLVNAVVATGAAESSCISLSSPWLSVAVERLKPLLLPDPSSSSEVTSAAASLFLLLLLLLLFSRSSSSMSRHVAVRLDELPIMKKPPPGWLPGSCSLRPFPEFLPRQSGANSVVTCAEGLARGLSGVSTTMGTAGDDPETSRSQAVVSRKEERPP